MIAVKDKKVVLQGNRNEHDRLWDVPLPTDYPIEKVDTQANNFTANADHAGLYASLL